MIVVSATVSWPEERYGRTRPQIQRKLIIK